MKTCTIDGCDKIHRAKGLCNTHYGQQNPNKYRMEERNCDLCEKRFSRVKRTDRYARTACGTVCRDILRWGLAKSDLPADHWARHYGKFSKWTPPKPTHDPQYTCAWCGDHAESSRTTTAYCGQRCKTAAKRVRRRGREYNAPGTYSWMEVTKLWVAFDKACAYCTQPAALADIQAEHVQAISKGGRNDLSNLLPSCLSCNADKRDLSLIEWAADRARRGLPQVNTEWQVSDVRYKHLVLMTTLSAVA